MRKIRGRVAGALAALVLLWSVGVVLSFLLSDRLFLIAALGIQLAAVALVLLAIRDLRKEVRSVVRAELDRASEQLARQQDALRARWERWQAPGPERVGASTAGAAEVAPADSESRSEKVDS